MTEPGTGAWEKAAEALAASDAAALEALLPQFSASAAKQLKVLARRRSGSRNLPANLPDGVVCVAERRFLAFFARKRAVVRWELPGRELVTGCYLTPGSAAEFTLEPGECRFAVLSEPCDAQDHSH